ncbi:unnamed protein product, partial [Larinioides sclopetarius]
GHVCGSENSWLLERDMYVEVRRCFLEWDMYVKAIAGDFWNGTCMWK